MHKRTHCLKFMSNIFIVATIAGIVLTLTQLFISHGTYFAELFFYDDLDTGMDFFHSIEYTKGRVPNEKFNNLYPPLANLCFYVLFKLIPDSQSEMWTDTGNYLDIVYARGTGIDLRVHQPSLMLFLLLVMFVSVTLLLLVTKIIPNNPYAVEIGICMLFSYGILYAIERGNIIALAVLCSMFFCFFKDSPNRIVKEAALILLAFAAGIKIYPAVFGILLLYDRRYREALRTVIYGILTFFLPTFAFKEGINGIKMTIPHLLEYKGRVAFSMEGYSVDKIFSTVIIIFQQILHFEINEEMMNAVLPKCNTIAALLILLLGFFLKKNWEKMLVCSLAIIIYKSQSTYILCFLLIPLLAMIKEEAKISYQNILPFMALVMANILLPLPNEQDSIISPMYVKGQICIIALLIYIIILGSHEVTGWMIKRREMDAEERRCQFLSLPK